MFTLRGSSAPLCALHARSHLPDFLEGVALESLLPVSLCPKLRTRCVGVPSFKTNPTLHLLSLQLISLYTKIVGKQKGVNRKVEQTKGLTGTEPQN